MHGRRILAAIFLLPALGAGYMTWVTWRAGDSGQWLFGVFAVFFLFLPIALLRPKSTRQAKPEPSPDTRFAPHWFMLLAMLVVMAGLLAAIITVIRRS
jgi:hypothetical protein